MLCGEKTFNKHINNAMTTVQADSVRHAAVTADSLDTHTHARPLTVKEVLDRLPAGATPAQQDSAVSANFEPVIVAPSTRPDTLGLPGYSHTESSVDLTLDALCRESYFTGKPCFDPDLYGGLPGVAGDPVPYSVGRDNLITALLLACFVFGAIALSKSRGFMSRQVRRFFRASRDDAGALTETSSELRFQFFLMMQTCLLLSLVTFFYIQTYVTDTFVVDQYVVIGAFFAIFVTYVMLKMLLQWLCGIVFFSRRRNESWMKSLLFIMSIEGLCLLPVVLLHAYFGFSVGNTLLSVSVVVIFSKILSFYKIYNIFFRRREAILQFFLYFCALEIMPVFALLGILGMAGDYLKVNF